MDMNSTNGSGHAPDWVMKVSGFLSDEAETLSLWKKLLMTIDTEGTSVAKGYLVSSFEALQRKASTEIQNIREQLDEEV